MSGLGIRVSMDRMWRRRLWRRWKGSVEQLKVRNHISTEVLSPSMKMSSCLIGKGHLFRDELE